MRITAGQRGRNSFARVALLAVATSAAVACSWIGASNASAYTGINSFSTVVSDTQAGGHPDVDLHINFDNRIIKDGVEVGRDPSGCECQDVESIITHFPTGFIGNPHSAARCTLALFSAEECAPESQVGVISAPVLGQVPLYNMEPHEGEPALLGFNVGVLGAPSFVVLSARTGSDYGLSSINTGIYHIFPLAQVHIYLWGIPALPVHDKYRFPLYQQSCGSQYPATCYAPVKSNASPQPLLQNPTTCGVPLTAGVDIVYYDGVVEHADAPWPSTTGCDQLSFNPSLTAQPTTKQADAPSGLDVELSVPQTLSATVPSPSQLRASRVTFPEGFTLNPNASDGKMSCSSSDARFGTELAPQCPEFSKIGTLELDTSVLPGAVPGGIYLGEPLPGNRYRVFLLASGFATHIKLEGTVWLDPTTGQIVTSFLDLPQSPLQRFSLHYFGSERGIFATPTKCGTYPVRSVFTPWNSLLPEQESLSFFEIETGPGGSPCPPDDRRFEPRLEAGTADNTAGTHTPFGLRLSRDDGDQTLTGIDLDMPPGFSAKLAGVPYCPEAAIAQFSDPAYPGKTETATPACPIASQIGTVTATSGAGSQPLHSPGRVFLAGPYRGGPLSLVIVVPAVSGPYDLGTVATRVALDVNPVTAEVTAVSDPLPQIIEGIPLRLRQIRVNLDRRDFTLNPTNCDPFSIDAVISGSPNGIVRLSQHFQVANCGVMAFGPKLALRLTGKMKRTGHPSLRATLNAAPGEANIAKTVVTLPETAILDNGSIGNVCTRVQFAADACPANSVYGTATVRTPLLDQPLSGPVHLRSSSNKVPDLVADLGGQIDVELSGRIDTAPNGGLRTSFESVPDVPVTSFSLEMKGGSSGLLEISKHLCRFPKRFKVEMTGQNGATISSKPRLQTPCGSKRTAKKAKRQLAREVIAR